MSACVAPEPAGWPRRGSINFSLTDVPARMGTWMSKTMIRAVKADASATGSVGGHSTFPTSRWMGSIAVRYRVTLDPAAAHCTLSVSVSIAASHAGQPRVESRTLRKKNIGQDWTPLTTAVSSPGRTRRRSPTCTKPLQTLPHTPVVEP